MAGPRSNPFLMGDRTYDFLKKMVQVVLPAFSALYFGLASIWNLPHPDKVVGTIAVVTTFLGVCLGISTAQYTASGKDVDGHMTLTPDGSRVNHIHFDGEPEDLGKKDRITFKVQRGSANHLDS